MPDPDREKPNDDTADRAYSAGGESHPCEFDAFICHASEDKPLFVRPLAERLVSLGLKIWLDEAQLAIGDGLRRSIERGLRSAAFGIVVLSPEFFRKEWPQRELDALFSMELSTATRILPVWHGVDSRFMRVVAPLLADRLAANSCDGIEKVAADLAVVIARHYKKLDNSPPPDAKFPPPFGDSVFDLMDDDDRIDQLYPKKR